MASLMGVPRAPAWGTQRFPWWLIPTEGNSEYRRGYRTEPKLLDFCFCMSFVLQNGYVPLSCENLKMEAIADFVL